MLCAKKFSFATQGGDLPPKIHIFLLKWFKMAPLSLYLENRASYFDDFCTNVILMIFVQMLEIVALSDLAPVLCAKKFWLPPLGGGFAPPKNTPF